MCLLHSEIASQKRRGKKTTAKDLSSSDSGSDDEENLSDEEVEFDDSDMKMDLDEDDDDDDDDGQSAGFNEEDVAFSDDDGKLIFMQIIFHVCGIILSHRQDTCQNTS